MKTRQVETVQGLAVCLGRDLRFAAALRYRVTVQRWLRQYRQGGLKKLLTVGKSKGRPKVIPDWAIKRLQQELCDPEGFDSYKEVQMWLEAVLGIKANYHVVHNLVRYQLKAKLKVARTRSFEQEPDAIETFKKNFQIL